MNQPQVNPMTHQTTFCSQCGTARQGGSQFCGGCGTPIQVQPTPVPVRNPPSPSPSLSQRDSNKALLAIILGVLGFVLCGPFTSIPGAFVAWNEMSAAKQAGLPSAGLAVVALWINVAATAIGLIGCMMTLPMMLMMGA